MKKSSLQATLDKIKDETLIIEEDNLPNKNRKVLIGGHFNLEVQRQLRILAAEEGKTLNTLLLEALELLFTKYGKKKF